MIDSRILEILACPRCESRPPLRLEKNFLICTVCETGYRIENDIPNLLPENGIEPTVWKSELEKSNG